MKQPIKGGEILKKNKKKLTTTTKKRKHKKEYGTSKLEVYFANEFLDKNGIKYVYQYPMSDIGRFLDFMIVYTLKEDCIMEDKDGLKSVSLDGQTVWNKVAIEIDGGYYHSDPRVIGEKKLNYMQRHNKWVDDVKNKWCGNHHIPLIRIWEYDIKNNPKLVMEELEKYIAIGDKKIKINENKKKVH